MSLAAVQLPSLEGLSLEKAFAAVTRETSNLADVDLVLLPELWVPGYFAFDQYQESAEFAPTVRSFLAELALELQSHVHGGSFVERKADEFFNTSILVGPDGRELATYSKMHLFGYGSREPEVLQPGKVPTVVDTPIGRIGMAVCYDLRFPELFRLMTDMGAEMVLVASAWPLPRVQAWSSLLQTRALENQIYIVGTNGVGPTQSGPILCGHSAVIDPWGTATAAIGDDAGVVRTTVDLDSVQEARQRLPQLADRVIFGTQRPELVFRRPHERPLRMPVAEVAIAGYTGRDREAVNQYVAGLEAEGVGAPDSIPAVFYCGADRVVSHDEIQVTSERTCGEVEFVLLVSEEGIHVTVGSDHTDRVLERDSIALSKQVVPKVVAKTAWRLEDVEAHWDRLTLSSWIGPERRRYQETGVDFFLTPREIIELVSPSPGTVIFGGTVSAISGTFDFDPLFEGSIFDPVLDRAITFRYRSRVLPS